MAAPLVACALYSLFHRAKMLFVSSVTPAGATLSRAAAFCELLGLRLAAGSSPWHDIGAAMLSDVPESKRQTCASLVKLLRLRLSGQSLFKTHENHVSLLLLPLLNYDVFL